MKNTVIKTMLIALISLFVLSSCDSMTDKITGEWTIKTVNGRTPADFAAANGVYELGTAKNFSITDKDVTVTAIDETGSIVTQTYKTVITDKGLDIDASGSTVSLEFIESDDQIRYSIKQNDNQYQYILKRGNTDLQGLLTVKAERNKTVSEDSSSTEQNENAA